MPRLLLPLILCVLIGSTSQARDNTPLPPVVARAMEQARIPARNVSIYVRKANTDEVVVSHNADQLRSPASTIKVLTTFVALDMLGPAYTWKTRAYADGRLVNGTLTGNLVLEGGGDPYMTSERWWNFAQSLRQAGLKKVTGNVVIDRSFFSIHPEDRGGFDNQPFRSYNVLPDALMVNFQTSRFTLIPESGRSRPSVMIDPLPANLVLRNEVRIGPGRCRGSNRSINFSVPKGSDATELSVRGVLATACGNYGVNRAIMSAPEYAYGTLRTFFTQLGGELEGSLELDRVPANARLIMTYPSLTLTEIIRLVNKYSNNVMARHLLLTLGAERFGAPATVENGRAAIDAWLKERDIEIPGLVVDNGSGLSRAERITARGMGEMLDVAWHSPFMPEFAASLPLSATDGTLRNRFRAPAMQGRLRLKTGTIDNVSGLAGFVSAASGDTYVMVILVNHPGAHFGTAEETQAALVRWIFGR